jgi:hypothetical protein
VRTTQLKKTAKALLSGDEDAVGIAEKGFKGKWAEFKEHLPGSGD